MPIYEYVCTGCGHPFERRVSFADADHVQSCPACGRPRAKKQVSLVARRATAGGGPVGRSAAACGPVG